MPEKQDKKDATATASAAVTVKDQPKPQESAVSVALLRKKFPNDLEAVEAFILKQGTGVKKPLSQWVAEYAASKQ